MRKFEMRNELIRKEKSQHWAPAEGGKGKKDSSLEKIRNKLRINQTL